VIDDVIPATDDAVTAVPLLDNAVVGAAVGSALVGFDGTGAFVPPLHAATPIVRATNSAERRLRINVMLHGCRKQQKLRHATWRRLEPIVDTLYYSLIKVVPGISPVC